MTGPVIKLTQDTLTLKWPDLQDLVRLVNAAEPGTTFDIDYATLSGKVRHGLELSVAPGTRTLLHKTWVISTDNLTLQDGTLQLSENTHILVTGKNVTFRNVTVSGLGRRGQRHEDPYLIRVANGGHLSLIQCILECESPQPHTLLVDSGGTCTVSSTRVYGGGVGCALKVSGGTAVVNKRSVVQGGTLVTAPQPKPPPSPVTTHTDPPTQQTPTTTHAAGDNIGVPIEAPCTQDGAQDSASQHEATTEAATGDEGAAVDTNAASTASCTAADASSPAAPPPPHTAAEPTHTSHVPAAQSPPPEATATQPTQPTQSNTATVTVTSRLEIRNSEILVGPAACLSAHGVGSSVLLDTCTVRGRANFGVLGSKGACVEMVGCEVVDSTLAGVTLSGGARLTAKESKFSSDTLGLRTQLSATADLHRCTCTSTRTPTGEPHPLPRAPPPGFFEDRVPDVPAPAEARGAGSAIVARDCVFGGVGVKGWRAVCGGQVAVQEGVDESLAPLATLAA